MIYRLNKDIYYVKGAVHGAIYCFSDKKVYWVKNTLNKELLEYFSNKIITERIQNIIDNKMMNPALVKQVELSDFENKSSHQLAWFELTQACNLKCLHCYDGNCHHSLENKLSLEQWKNVASRLKELDFKEVILIGGEPLAYPYFLEILDHCHEIGLKTVVFSNLTLMNEDILKHIIETKSEVHFSIYGNEEHHEKITQVKGSFNKTIYWLKRLHESNIKTIPSVVMMKENIDQYDNIKQTLEEIGISFQRADAIRPMDDGEQSEHMPSVEQMKKFEIHEANFFADKKLFYANLFGNSCLYGKLSINENGDVYPCEFIRDSFGNVLNEEVLSIINRLKADVWTITHDDIKECKDCEFRYACKDCRHLSLKNKTKKYRCFYSPNEGVFK